MKNFVKQRGFFIFCSEVDVLFRKGATGNVEMLPLVEMSEEEESNGEGSGLKSVDVEYEQKVEGTAQTAPPKLKRLRT